MKKYLFDIGLLIISLTALFVAVISCNNCSDHSFIWIKDYNGIILNLSCGWLGSYFFYLLVVKLPERDKKILIRKNLLIHYDQFRENSISIFLALADGSYDSTLPKKLLNQEEFKKYFKGQNQMGRDRWYEIANKLDDRYLKDLNFQIDIFIEEISYILGVTDINDESFLFFKRLAYFLKQTKNNSLEYDDVKTLLLCLWEIFSGWSWAEGYIKNDVIRSNIKGL